MRRKLMVLIRPGLIAVAALGLMVMMGHAPAHGVSDDSPVKTVTPIKHLVVIFQENVSFDHYFGTYPNAANPAGEPQFKPSPGTPNVNGLNGVLLSNNPNFLNAANGKGAANPFRLDRSQNFTADQDHDYTPEQQAFDFGLMDAFPEFTGTAGPPPSPPPGTVKTPGLVMGYYDGNTGYSALELRPELCAKRQLLRHQFRPLVTRCPQSRLGPDQWRNQHGKRALN
jgi:phospholipase C